MRCRATFRTCPQEWNSVGELSRSWTKTVGGVAANFPDECRYVLEMLGQVYGYEADARERGLTPKERLRFHHERSGPVMGPTARLVGGSICRAQNGAELRAG